MSDPLIVQNFNIYLGLAVVGIFSGLGTAMGQYFFNEWIKRHFDKLKNKEENGGEQK